MWQLWTLSRPASSTGFPVGHRFSSHYMDLWGKPLIYGEIASVWFFFPIHLRPGEQKPTGAATQADGQFGLQSVEQTRALLHYLLAG